MERIPCQLCGDEALPATIERTGGYCMPCFKDPEGRRAQVAEARRPKPSLEEALDQLHQQLGPALVQVARQAVSELGHEGIYGFNIENGGVRCGVTASVLSEAGISVTWKQYYKDRYDLLDPDSQMSKGVRWNLADAKHLEYSDSTSHFEPIKVLFRDLWPFRDEPDIEEKIERRIIWAVRSLRESEVFNDDVVITAMLDTMGSEEKVAWAEYFNSSEALQRFCSEIGPLNHEIFQIRREYLEKLMSTND